MLRRHCFAAVIPNSCRLLLSGLPGHIIPPRWPNPQKIYVDAVPLPKVLTRAFDNFIDQRPESPVRRAKRRVSTALNRQNRRCRPFPPRWQRESGEYGATQL
ncbi:hypothetical protein KCP74_15095 [Salmonella enterica subsp. enterica]|nr:hypothetical protein KCP74_15095 [Salmonella enterica subsp. enterica]